MGSDFTDKYQTYIVKHLAETDTTDSNGSFTLWRLSLHARAFLKCRKYISVLQKALA